MRPIHWTDARPSSSNVIGRMTNFSHAASVEDLRNIYELAYGSARSRFAARRDLSACNTTGQRS